MNDAASDLADIFGTAVAALVRYYVICEGTVSAVNDDKTVDVAIENATFSAVPLKVIYDGATPVNVSDLETPAVGADVLIGFRDGSLQRPQVLVIQEGTKREFNYNNVIFNGGLLGGMVKAKELRLQSEKDKAIIDAVLQVVNGAVITEPGGGAPSALQAALKAALAGLQSGTWDNLENDKITQ